MNVLTIMVWFISKRYDVKRAIYIIRDVTKMKKIVLCINKFATNMTSLKIYYQFLLAEFAFGENLCRHYDVMLVANT